MKINDIFFIKYMEKEECISKKISWDESRNFRFKDFFEIINLSQEDFSLKTAPQIALIISSLQCDTPENTPEMIILGGIFYSYRSNIRSGFLWFLHYPKPLPFIVVDVGESFWGF